MDLAWALLAARFQVIVFLSPGCPLSERSLPELRTLAAEFSSQSFSFEAVSAQPATFNLPFPLSIDGAMQTARRLNARVTPQAVVLDSAGRIVYSGRIDDRFRVAGGIPAEATRRDLREALVDLAAGRSVQVPETTAVGCAITFPQKANATPRTTTYRRQVAPILNRHCASCHRPNGSAPFDLTTFAAASPRAAAIAAAVRDRRMPPWLADPQPAHPFEGASHLGARDLAVLDAWVAAGTPEGSGPIPEPPPAPPDWELGLPDLIVDTPDVEIAPSADDEYRCLVIPLSHPVSRYVRAFQFRPGNRTVVHHALFFTDGRGTARQLDAADPAPGYSCFGTPGFLPQSTLGGWTPGFGATQYPPGAATRIPAAGSLVLQIHYQATGRTESDRSQLGLYFQPVPPTRRMMDVALGTRHIDIAPGEANYRVRDHFTLPVPVEVTGVIPHAHYIARQMRAWATLPTGRRIPLITIRRWDFRWQRHFQYAKPFTLPADTRVEMEFVYDNSAANPSNPNRPPRRVVWGGNSTDEMAGLHLQVIPANDDDARELGQSLWGKLMRELGGSIPR